MGIISPKELRTKKGKNILIRTATPDDATNLVSFHQCIMNEAPYLLTTAEEFSITSEKQAEFLTNMYESQDKILMIAVHKEEVVGSLDFYGGRRLRNKHDGSLGMSVSSEWRNQGIGDLLLTALKKWVNNHPHLIKISLEVFENNEDAIHLYQRHGFKVEGRKEKAIRTDDDYQDLLIMGYIFEGKMN